MRYADRHRKVSESGKLELINSYLPARCLFYGCEDFVKRGLTASGIQRYLCTCKKTFPQPRELSLTSISYQLANGLNIV
jgi:transposase-like protein